MGNFFTRRKWYFAAVALCVGALASECWSKRITAQAVVSIAQRAADRHAGIPVQELSLDFRQSQTWTVAGLLFAIGAAACRFVSYTQSEPGVPAILLGLFCAYGLFLALVV
jgi:hypothetical protein